MDKDFFVLKIENLNTYLYKVEMNNTDVDTSEKLPSNCLIAHCSLKKTHPLRKTIRVGF